MKYLCLLLFIIFLSCKSKPTPIQQSKEIAKVYLSSAIKDNVDYCTVCTDLSIALLNPDSVSYLFLYDLRNDSIEVILQFPNLIGLRVFNSKELNFSKLFLLIGKHENIEDLNIADCDMTNLPKEIYNIKNLKRLEIDDTLKNISNRLYELTKLNDLNINVEKVSDSLSMLSSLRKLRLNIIGTKELPKVITRLPNLETLFLSSDIIMLPKEIINLKRLKTLDITMSKLAMAEFKYYAIHSKFNYLEMVKENLPNCNIVMNGHYW